MSNYNIYKSAKDIIKLLKGNLFVCGELVFCTWNSRKCLLCLLDLAVGSFVSGSSCTLSKESHADNIDLCTFAFDSYANISMFVNDFIFIGSLILHWPSTYL